jgi:16S rRNA (uracil1498-N3)-methyltransferase
VNEVTWYPLPSPEVHVVTALTGLHGSRSDWLIEKCTELGAHKVIPLVSQHAPALHNKGTFKQTRNRADGGIDRHASRHDRWQRVAEAAVKQSLRLHSLHLSEPCTMQGLIEEVGKAGTVTLVGAEGGAHVLNALQQYMPKHHLRPDSYTRLRQNPRIAPCNATEETVSNADGPIEFVQPYALPKRLMLAIGPPGDFSVQELEHLHAAGAVLVGLGKLRLRVETATLALLAASMLHIDRTDEGVNTF